MRYNQIKNNNIFSKGLECYSLQLSPLVKVIEWQCWDNLIGLLYVYSKADWQGIIYRNEFQSSFLFTCEGKSTEQLWQEFKGEIDNIVEYLCPHQNP